MGPLEDAASVAEMEVAAGGVLFVRAALSVC
jgi:hypothetical protein